LTAWNNRNIFAGTPVAVKPFGKSNLKQNHMPPLRDHPAKSILKAISWRIIGTIDTMIISYLLTGRLVIALSIGSIEVFTKMILYYFHERAWEYFPQQKLRFPFLFSGFFRFIQRAKS
jgi:uncharacterized membrane protein